MATENYRACALCAAIAAGLLLVAGTAPADGAHGHDARTAGIPDASAIRSALWIDVYACSIFAAGDERALLDGQIDSPLAIRFDITTDMLPARAPRSWQSALDPFLKSEQSDALAGAFLRFGDGDTLVFDYAPGHGTRVYASEMLLFRTGDKALISAVSDMLLGPDPVSRRLRNKLVDELREPESPSF